MDTPTQTNKFNSNTAILILAMIITCIGPFASDCYLPALPDMTKAFSSTTSIMQLTITLYLLGFSLSQLLYGPLSDCYGRRNVVLSGLGICVTGSLFAALAPNAHFLLYARLLQGAGAGVTLSIFRAVMRDTFSGPQLSKLASYVGVAYALAPAIAPIIGSYLHTLFGWRSCFIFLFFLISAAWLALWYYLPETNKQLNPHAIHPIAIIKNYIKILTDKGFIGFTLCASLAYAGILAYFTISPFLLQNILHLTPIEYGWSVLFITAGAMAGQLTNSFIVNYLLPIQVMLIGICGMVFSGLVMMAFHLAGYLNVVVICIPSGFFLLFTCLVFSNAMAGALHSFANMAGSAAALYGCIQVFCSFVITLFIASLHSHTQLPLASILICLGTTSLLSYILLVARQPLRKP